MKIKTRDLIGTALNWAVGKGREWGNVEPPKDYTCGCGVYVEGRVNPAAIHIADCPYNGKYTTDWRVGGAIIERYKINIEYPREDFWTAYVWLGRPNAFAYGTGDTPLIAAMRCFVASKLGDEVEIPDTLL